MRMGLLISTCLLSGCAYHTFAPGPGMSANNFEPDSAKCRMYSRGQQSGFSFAASGSPRFVAASTGGAALGYAVGSAVQANQNYNDCMIATGWRVIDKQPVGNAAMSGSLAVSEATTPTPLTVVTAQPLPVVTAQSVVQSRVTTNAQPTPTYAYGRECGPYLPGLLNDGACR